MQILTEFLIVRAQRYSWDRLVVIILIVASRSIQEYTISTHVYTWLHFIATSERMRTRY